MRLRIGSRGSQLAVWQAQHVAERLRARGHEVRVEVIHTSGDRVGQAALGRWGVKGLFTREIEEALAADRVDLGVHSLKDLPTEISEAFEVAAVLEREDARDALCSNKYASLEELPHGARVGTSSLRRQAQLKAFRADLAIHPLRGNVDTRLAKLARGEFDAVVLAWAGLRRLGKTESVRQVLPVNVMCPAAGQGALAVEIQKGARELAEALAFLNDPTARRETDCERALLKELGGGCQVPIGAYARWQNGRFELEALVADPEGTLLLRESGRGEDPLAVAGVAARNLLGRGGAAILDQLYGKEASIPEQP
ncbi:MAG: hydroxymethylbilane synthase [Acidobacteria bacterium]|nr:hydroxymethylbilane synthase [Acidobacteriota bacterium]